jgi:predicted AlkP superfamily phosphohydrolase/phosphomutase
VTAPLVIFGIDCGDPALLEQWLADGSLPALAALRARGAWGRVASPEQVAEMGTALSLYSGRPRAEHGYYAFRQFLPGTYMLRSFSPRQTGVLPFWAQLRERGRRVLILDAAECALVPGLPGRQLANWATHQPAFPHLPAEAEPAGVLAEARAVFGPQQRLPEFVAHATLARDQRALPAYLARVRQKGRLLRTWLAQDAYDLVVAEFHEPHTGGHRYWPYRPELQLDGPPPNALVHALRALYQAVDHEIGLTLPQLPANANVVLVTHYGMQDMYPCGALLADMLMQLGYALPAAPAPARPPRTPLELARRLLPEPLRLRLSHYLPPATQERLLLASYGQGVDWSRTTAYAHPDYFNGMLRVNLRGREPQGCVAPGAEHEALLDRLTADLLALIDPVTQRPAISRVVRTAAESGGAPPAQLPDLFAHWAPVQHFIPRLRHPRATLTQPRPQYYRNSGHYFEGAVIAAGPDVHSSGNIGRVPLLSLAPTFLTLLGEPVPAAWPGRALPEFGPA